MTTDPLSLIQSGGPWTVDISDLNLDTDINIDLIKSIEIIRKTQPFISRRKKLKADLAILKNQSSSKNPLLHSKTTLEKAYAIALQVIFTILALITPIMLLKNPTLSNPLFINNILFYPMYLESIPT
jgi:hypothetical protein